MAKKKNALPDQDDYQVPGGNVDEDGDELLDLYDAKDDFSDDKDYDLSKIEDDMLSEETEEEEVGPEISDVEAMLRMIKCTPCTGSKSKSSCSVRDDFGCPPDKAEKFVPWSDDKRKKKVRRDPEEDSDEDSEEDSEEL